MNIIFKFIFAIYMEYKIFTGISLLNRDYLKQNLLFLLLIKIVMLEYICIQRYNIIFIMCGAFGCKKFHLCIQNLGCRL
jgi:hypothetical protein